METHPIKFVVGVFRSGKLLFPINVIKCTHNQADFMVRLLIAINAESALCPKDYFAYDYAKAHNLN